ncbi:Penicillinase repressor [Aquisphaera giovannonii]|uniref:Penicillinase repressor n=1 Tax=Aquisphaera giovannonii TaxID=406548 RepID=A0A5B9W6V7_9BACT|nr:BlaI/MecI/CopY family transcriptional regulator [Aquisphaera giovannonii]QEH35805.1 Penicillinase repressor [Aquisphaera giovannonii]
MGVAGDVTEAELAILRLLWEGGPSTARQLIDRLYPEGRSLAHPTVQKLLDRLEAKGCIRRDRTGPVQVFEAAIGRDDLVDRRLRRLADQLCGGSLGALFSHLVRGRRMPARDRKVLRDFLETLDEGAKDHGGEGET